jgi:hypothetical protein
MIASSPRVGHPSIGAERAATGVFSIKGIRLGECSAMPPELGHTFGR